MIISVRQFLYIEDGHECVLRCLVIDSKSENVNCKMSQPSSSCKAYIATQFIEE